MLAIRIRSSLGETWSFNISRTYLFSFFFLDILVSFQLVLCHSMYVLGIVRFFVLFIFLCDHNMLALGYTAWCSADFSMVQA